MSCSSSRPTARLAALGAIAGGAAHGLGNSLFGVLGLVELLLADAEPGSAAAERLVLVRRAALELKETLGALAGATRPALDGDVPAPLDEIVRATAAFFRRVSAAVRLELVERYPEEPLPVAATARDRAPARPPPAPARLGGGRHGRRGRARGGLGRRSRPAARPRRRATAAEPDTGLGLLAAGALARAEGGSLETPAPGELLLRLPLTPAAAEKPRADSAAPTMAPAPARDDDGSASR